MYISGHMIQMVMQRANAKRDNRSKDMLWSSALFGGQEQENNALKKMSVHRSQQTTRDFAVPKIRAGNVSKNRESAISRSAGQP